MGDGTADLVLDHGDAAGRVEVRERNLTKWGSNRVLSRKQVRQEATATLCGGRGETHLVASGKDDRVAWQLYAVLVHDRALLELADVGADQQRLLVRCDPA